MLGFYDESERERERERETEKEREREKREKWGGKRERKNYSVIQLITCVNI